MGTPVLAVGDGVVTKVTQVGMRVCVFLSLFVHIGIGHLSVCARIGASARGLYDGNNVLLYKYTACMCLRQKEGGLWSCVTTQDNSVSGIHARNLFVWNAITLRLDSGVFVE